MHLTTPALVLRVTDYKDHDALLTLLSPNHGKLTVKARGLRRKNSPLVAPCQLLSYGEFTGEFVITDLPAGKTVIVLEKNRSTFPKQDYLSFMLQDVVRFKENMDVCADRFEITGMEGALNVRNISQTDIDGDVYVYYKMISGDVLYGGITFRVKIEGGLRAGELRQVSSEHFSPDRCMIMSVTTEE